MPQQSDLPPSLDVYQNQNIDVQLQAGSFNSPLLSEALPPPPTPPESRNNLIVSPQISVVSEASDNQACVLNKEEPKYARVDLKNKRNSKQLPATGASDM